MTPALGSSRWLSAWLDHHGATAEEDFDSRSDVCFGRLACVTAEENAAPVGGVLPAFVAGSFRRIAANGLGFAVARGEEDVDEVRVEGAQVRRRGNRVLARAEARRDLIERGGEPFGEVGLRRHVEMAVDGAVVGAVGRGRAAL